MSEDYKIFDQKPATVTNILEVLALAESPLKNGYVVATEANIAELAKNLKDVREAPSFTDLMDVFGERLHCREKKCQMETKIFDSKSINALSFAEALELLDFKSYIPTDVICHPSWEECPQCRGDKQQWNMNVRMMEDCFLCRGTGETTFLTSCGYRAGQVTKDSETGQAKVCATPLKHGREE